MDRARRQLLDGKQIVCCDLLEKAGSDVTWQALESYYSSPDRTKNVEQLFEAQIANATDPIKGSFKRPGLEKTLDICLATAVVSR